MHHTGPQTAGRIHRHIVQPTAGVDIENFARVEISRCRDGDEGCVKRSYERVVTYFELRYGF
jgi:hypothetical protein